MLETHASGFGNAGSAGGYAGMHVADLARRAGVSPATIRYYSRSGLLDPGREEDSGYRKFSSEDLHRVMFIRQAQALGLTLADIQAVFEDVEQGLVPCGHVVALVEVRLDSIRAQIAALEVKEQRMRSALEQWQGASDHRGNEEPGGDEFCPLIERLELTPR